MSTNKSPKELLQEEVIYHLIQNKKYFEDVFPYLKSEYFNYEYGVILDHIHSFYKEYKTSPNLKELVLTFQNSPKQEKDIIKEKINELKLKPTDAKGDTTINHDLLMNLSEKYIKQKIFEKAIITGAEGLGSNNEEKLKKSFQLAEESVKVNLSSDLGIKLNEISKRFDDYLPKNGIKLNIESFDNMIGDGYTPSTLHLIISPSGVGKSAMLSTFAVQFLLQKRDVVIISLEMAESQFYKRIDANLFDIPIHDLGTKIENKEVLEIKYNEFKDDLGNLYIKEFPAGSLTPLGIDAYLNKLANEEQIKNPIVMVDYLTLLKSDILKQGDNSYGYFKSVAEELRSVAQKRKIIIFSPMQSNRSSINNIEADQSTLSDSMAVYMTADSAFMILQTPEMKQEQKMKINFVKNRMSGKTYNFDIGYDYSKFRIVDKYKNTNTNTNTNTNNDIVNNQIQEANNFLGLD